MMYNVEMIIGHMFGHGMISRFHVVWQGCESSWESASSFVFPAPNGWVHVNSVFEQYIASSNDPRLRHVFKVAFDLAQSEAEIIMFDIKRRSTTKRVTSDHIMAMLSL
jgi:hypothetical protein